MFYYTFKHFVGTLSLCSRSLWTYTHDSYPHRGTRRDGWTPPPRVFDILQYYETILPSVKSLSFPALKNVVYFMGGGAVGGL